MSAPQAAGLVGHDSHAELLGLIAQSAFGCPGLVMLTVADSALHAVPDILDLLDKIEGVFNLDPTRHEATPPRDGAATSTGAELRCGLRAPKIGHEFVVLADLVDL